MLLKDKAIIVTGSTTGIGAGIARRCVDEGAKVLVHGRSEERAKALVKRLGSASTYHIDDMADPESPARIVASAVKAFGKIDGLVNNAAWVKRGDLASTDSTLFDTIMAVNARAPMLMIREAIGYLQKSEGSVVGIGSINAYTGEPRQLPYAMSKAAHATMSRNLANAYASKRVRFNHFNVGWVLTDNEYQLKISEGLGKDWPERMAGGSEVPSGRMTSPEDIAAHTVFWLSDQSRPISGAVIDLEQFSVVGRLLLKEGD